jgi:hypothetical protein
LEGLIALPAGAEDELRTLKWEGDGGDELIKAKPTVEDKYVKGWNVPTGYY